MWGKWIEDEEGAYYEPLSAREFRYDSVRSRYAAAELDVNGSVQPHNWTLAAPFEYTDCVGDTPWVDREVAESSLTQTAKRRYFGLGGDQALDSQGAATATSYWHEDLIGSRSMLSDDAGDLAGRIAYSAFGELLDASGLPGGSPPASSPRYQYAAAHGFESDLLTLQGPNTDLPPIILQHLGHRWYQPDIGRFIQRDPIGIFGGMNVFLYVDAAPVDSGDPDGLTKGGKQNIDPSDLPPFWRRLNLPDKIKWLNDAIKNAQSLKHAQTLRGFLKVLKRGGTLCILITVGEKASELIHDAVTWKPNLPPAPVPRAGEWRKFLD